MCAAAWMTGISAVRCTHVLYYTQFNSKKHKPSNTVTYIPTSKKCMYTFSHYPVADLINSSTIWWIHHMLYIENDWLQIRSS